MHGVLTSAGVFEGSIVTETSEHYVIERASRYFSEPRDFHSVIYRESDVILPARLNTSRCYADTLHEALQRNATRSEQNGPNFFKYARSRHKRDIDHSKTTCTLYVQADHLFYKKFGSNQETVIEQLTQHVQGVNDIYRIIGESCYVVLIEASKEHTHANIVLIEASKVHKK